MSTITVADSKLTFSRAMKNCSFICSVFVILIHTYNVEIYNIGPNSIIYWIEYFFEKNIVPCAVPFFFVSSAFFLYQKPRETVSVYKSRFKSIVLPYFLWNTIYMISFSILKRLSLSDMGMDRINIIDILKGIFLYQYNYVYWFMFCLIGFTLLYPIIKQVICRNKYLCFFGLLVLIAVYFFSTTNHQTDNLLKNITSERLISSFIYYYLGAIGGYYYKEQIEKISVISKKWVAVIALGLLGLVLSIIGNIFDINNNFLNNLVIIVLLLLILSSSKIAFPKSFLGLSFMIYSMHLIILECVEKIIFIIFPHNALWAMVNYFIAPVITLMIIVVLCAAMKKVCPRFYAILNGNRK